MKNLKTILVLCLCVILLSAFSTALAQDETAPAFKVSEVVSDTTVTVITKNFPADTSYLVSLGDPQNADSVSAVAKFNSKNGGALSVTVKIPEKFHGKEFLNIILTDPNGGKIEGSFANLPAATEEPTEESVPMEEPTEEPAPTEEPTEEPIPTEEPTEEPVATEEPTEEPAPTEEPTEEPVATEEPTEEPIPTEEPTEEPAPTEEPTEEPVATEEPTEEPIPTEEPTEEPAPTEEPTEEPVAAEDILQSTAVVCNYSVIPYVYIDSVVKDASVTFTTYNFPADSSFSVQMGVFNGTYPGNPQPPHHNPEPPIDEPMPEPPEPQPQPAPIPFGNEGEVALTQLIRDLDAPAPSFNRPEGPGPKPQPVVSAVPSFSGQEVGTYETGDGSSRTLTFEIPESLKGVGTIALWIADQGPCGFYAYNYFYNN